MPDPNAGAPFPHATHRQQKPEYPHAYKVIANTTGRPNA